MKKINSLAIAIVFGFLSLASLPAQSPFGYPPPVAPTHNTLPQLTRFDLDFPGGSPQALVKAIERATRKPLNAIINNEYASAIVLPPLKMSNVTVAQLFQALASSSQKMETYPNGPYGYATASVNYGFQTDGNPTDDSVWYFYVHAAPKPQIVKTSRFYLLTPDLERGLTVDDITTAIQTSWRMLGYHETAPGAPMEVDAMPQLSYHKETKLLIAVGEAFKLEAIDNVLKALQPRPLADQEKLLNLLKAEKQSLNSGETNQPKPTSSKP